MSKLVISEKLREFRSKSKMTQKSIGDILGVSPQAVSKWELGLSYPDVTILPELSRLLSCDIGDFFE
ncbi:MAG: helix-turn-helix transcriptional regulator [Clostridia bacterium]|nr:helix-turn-helix transcriptional regulator [Clostridia bacterium]